MLTRHFYNILKHYIEMRISAEDFKNITSPIEVEERALKAYLASLYQDDEYESKDDSYVKNENPEAVHGYRERAGRLVDKLKELSFIEFASSCSFS